MTEIAPEFNTLVKIGGLLHEMMLFRQQLDSCSLGSSPCIPHYVSLFGHVLEDIERVFPGRTGDIRAALSRIENLSVSGHRKEARASLLEAMQMLEKIRAEMFSGRKSQ